MADEALKALDATDQTQIIDALKDWINGLEDPETHVPIMDDKVYLELQNGGFGYCIKSMGGNVADEDVTGDFSAEVQFGIYYTSNSVPDSDTIFRSLNNLAAWFRKNGTAELDIGARRIPDEIKTLKDATHLSGPDELGNVTFVSVFGLTYDEEKGEY